MRVEWDPGPRQKPGVLAPHWHDLLGALWEPFQGLGQRSQSGSSEVQEAHDGCSGKTLEDRHLLRVPGSKTGAGNQSSWLGAHTVPGCDHGSFSRLAPTCTGFLLHVHTYTYFMSFLS